MMNKFEKNDAPTIMHPVETIAHICPVCGKIYILYEDCKDHMADEHGRPISWVHKEVAEQ